VKIPAAGRSTPPAIFWIRLAEGFSSPGNEKKRRNGVGAAGMEPQTTKVLRQN
jgi:hypothetical protein